MDSLPERAHKALDVDVHIRMMQDLSLKVGLLGFVGLWDGEGDN